MSLVECIAESVKCAHHLSIEPHQIGDARDGNYIRNLINQTNQRVSNDKQDNASDQYYTFKGDEQEYGQWKGEETVKLVAQSGQVLYAGQDCAH